MSYSNASLKDKNVLVIGLGVSGRSAARFLLLHEARVVGVDDRFASMKELSEVASLEVQGLVFSTPDSYSLEPDLVVLSPGVPVSHPLVIKALQNGWEVIGEIELACRYLSQRMIGITGTNGKTTVTLLIEHVLQQAGLSAKAVGNSGVPLTSVLCERQALDVLVVELSSYQLETLSAHCLDAALLLNITPDHLDRYQDFEAYVLAKLRITSCLKPGGVFFVNESCAAVCTNSPALSYGYHSNCAVYTDLIDVYYGKEKMFALPEAMKGKRSHDLENMLAAYAVCREFDIAGEQFIQAFARFSKPPHRIEFVRSHHDIVYVDDSKGTNLDAVISAVKSIKGDVVLIAGGVDKGSSYSPWIEAFAGKVRCICAIGQAAVKMKHELNEHIPVQIYPTLDEAVSAASRQARPHDTVLLSPGCSSFDMFKDYAHRGDEFKRLVQAL